MSWFNWWHFFFLREVHESLCLWLTMSQAPGNQTSPRQEEARHRGPDLVCPVYIVPTTDLVRDKSSTYFGRDTGSLQREACFTFTHLCRATWP